MSRDVLLAHGCEHNMTDRVSAGAGIGKILFGLTSGRKNRLSSPTHVRRGMKLNAAKKECTSVMAMRASAYLSSGCCLRTGEPAVGDVQSIAGGLSAARIPSIPFIRVHCVSFPQIKI